jgi:ATP-dependent DNA helicase RecG
MQPPPVDPGVEPLARPIGLLRGVGKTRLAALADAGVNTLGDLLEYFPRTYQIERSERPIAQLAANDLQYARGEVVAVNYTVGGRPRFEATLQDPTGKLALTWFNGGYLRTRIHPGQILRVRGKVAWFRGIPSMVQPKFELIPADAPPVGEDIIRAVYPAHGPLTSPVLWKLIDAHLDEALEAIREWFPADLLRRRGLMARREAYRAIHQPTLMQEAREARRRLVYDEFMLLQIALALSRKLRQRDEQATPMKFDRLLDERIRKRFPFTLTQEQHEAAWQIARDLMQPRPMNRLLQGDVGCGKTVVALFAMLIVVANGGQAAVLAPTETLAEQHYVTLTSLLASSAVRVELFTQRTKKESRGAVQRDLAAGAIHIAVGTQALLQGDIEFPRLGLVVVDEQHKLGVRQRATLRSKGPSPHYLVMTATPIPRTLALSLFADFDVTTIRQMPTGRQPIQTQWFREAQRTQAMLLLTRELDAGRQAYIVVPQVEEGMEAELGAKSVASEYERLVRGPLIGRRVGRLHGQMPTEEKRATMLAFRSREIEVLVCTTVIEVGIDVPNASLMLVENAEHFGLSQLHQLRGRVGRGSVASHCLLMSDAENDDARERLAALCQMSSGFDIAETDLKLRGPGEFFGFRQHGMPEFKLADIAGELDLLKAAAEDAAALVDDDPQLLHPSLRAMRHELVQKFAGTLQLPQVG